MCRFAISFLTVFLLAGPSLADGPTLLTGRYPPLKPMLTGLKHPESA